MFLKIQKKTTQNKTKHITSSNGTNKKAFRSLHSQLWIFLLFSCGRISGFPPGCSVLGDSGSHHPCFPGRSQRHQWKESPSPLPPSTLLSQGSPSILLAPASFDRLGDNRNKREPMWCDGQGCIDHTATIKFLQRGDVRLKRARFNLQKLVGNVPG